MNPSFMWLMNSVCNFENPVWKDETVMLKLSSFYTIFYKIKSTNH